MRAILGTTKDTSTEDIASIEARHKTEQVKGYFKTMQNSKNPLYDAVKEERRYTLAIGKSWIGKAEQSIQHVYSLGEIKPYHKTVREPRHIRREWPAEKKKQQQKTKTKTKQFRSTNVCRSQQ